MPEDQPVNYRDECKKLSKVPNIEVELEPIFLMTADLPARLEAKDLFVASVDVGKETHLTEDRIELQALPGGLWPSYARDYASTFRKWLTLVMFSSSRLRFVLVNGSRELSALAIKSTVSFPDTILFLVVAEGRDTPMEQHLSYVSLMKALQGANPVVAVSSGFVKEFTLFDEEEWLLNREEALEHLISMLMRSTENLRGVLYRGVSLGVKLHSVSVLVAASDKVYRDPTQALTALRKQRPLEYDDADVKAATLFASGPSKLQASIRESFYTYCSDAHANLLEANFFFREKESTYGLYDLALVLGLKSSKTIDDLWQEYRQVVKEVPNLDIKYL